jgi:peptidoglycan hydrolase-like protein with peptidoglycan-binding domain
VQFGDRGDAVFELQEALGALGYWRGPADSSFGDDTFHAVVALQKVAGLAPDGIVGPATRAALAAKTVPSARSTSGAAIEIDLEHQVLLVVDDGVVQQVFDTSTGSVEGTTPTGAWRIEREIDGFRRSELGLLYRPKYFYEGVAIHGYTSVPPYPASHGCVRLTYSAMDWMWMTNAMPIGTTVLVY